MTTQIIKNMKAIMADYKKSVGYLNETGDNTSAKGRRAVQLMINVDWLVSGVRGRYIKGDQARSVLREIMVEDMESLGSL